MIAHSPPPQLHFPFWMPFPILESPTISSKFNVVYKAPPEVHLEISVGLKCTVFVFALYILPLFGDLWFDLSFSEQINVLVLTFKTLHDTQPTHLKKHLFLW